MDVRGIALTCISSCSWMYTDELDRTALENWTLDNFIEETSIRELHGCHLSDNFGGSLLDVCGHFSSL